MNMNYISLQGHTRPKILIIMHQATSIPGRVGMILQNMGYDLVACRPPLGEQLPKTLDGYEGAVVFGGPMSANDPEDYIKQEIDWMEVPLKENKPLLGICLGAQMLAKHLGGDVRSYTDNYAEIGYYPIKPTDEGTKLINWPSHAYQWHREGFSLPKDASLLVSGDVYPNQAYKYGEKAFGVQFHAEVSHLMMNRWTTKAFHRMNLPGAQTRQQHFDGRLIHDKQIRTWLADFLKLWLKQPAKINP